MNLHRPFRAIVVLLSLSAAVAGCATHVQCADGACGADAVITTNVRSLLDQHAELGSPHSIEVQTSDRVVYLNGQVNDGLDRSIAESVAMQTPGVIKVVNSIAVQK